MPSSTSARRERVGARAGDLQQLGLAVVAAVGRVLREPRPFELVRFDHLEAGADAGGQLASPAARSLAAIVIETAVSATQRSPSTSCATRSSSVESTPPEKQTSADP